MIKKVSTVPERYEEIIRLGKEGKANLQDVADVWGCDPANVATYLYELQKQKGYAYLVDGKGYFRIFQEIQ